jgi:hypothetical protein
VGLGLYRQLFVDDEMQYAESAFARAPGVCIHTDLPFLPLTSLNLLARRVKQKWPLSLCLSVSKHLSVSFFLSVCLSVKNLFFLCAPASALVGAGMNMLYGGGRVQFSLPPFKTFF